MSTGADIILTDIPHIKTMRANNSFNKAKI
jgi:hypothetical protein